MIGLEEALWILYAQAGYGVNRQAQISVLSAQVLMHMGGGRGCLDCSVCTSLPWVTHLPTCPDWIRRLQAEMGTGLLPSRSLSQMQMGTPAHYTPLRSLTSLRITPKQFLLKTGGRQGCNQEGHIIAVPLSFPLLTGADTSVFNWLTDPFHLDTSPSNLSPTQYIQVSSSGILHCDWILLTIRHLLPSLPKLEAWEPSQVIHLILPIPNDATLIQAEQVTPTCGLTSFLI